MIVLKKKANILRLLCVRAQGFRFYLSSMFRRKNGARAESRAETVISDRGPCVPFVFFILPTFAYRGRYIEFSFKTTSCHTHAAAGHAVDVVTIQLVLSCEDHHFLYSRPCCELPQPARNRTFDLISTSMHWSIPSLVDRCSTSVIMHGWFALTWTSYPKGTCAKLKLQCCGAIILQHWPMYKTAHMLSRLHCQQLSCSVV